MQTIEAISMVFFPFYTFCHVLFPRVMVTGTLCDRQPAELHLFRNYPVPETKTSTEYKTSASFKPLTQPEGKCWHTAVQLVGRGRVHPSETQGFLFFLPLL